MAVIVFDVNETLLDLSGLDDAFGGLVGAEGEDEDGGGRAGELKRLWFARLLHTSSVMTQIGTFRDFGEVGRIVLVDVAGRLGVDVTDDQAAEVVAAMRRLPPHADAVQGITALADAGHRVVALTNSGREAAHAQLAHAGLDALLERILTVDDVRRFKPDRAVYEWAAQALDADVGDMVMVACHDWDCAGAMSAGMRAGYVARPGTGYSPVLPPPTWRGGDLVSLAAAIGDAS